MHATASLPDEDKSSKVAWLGEAYVTMYVAVHCVEKSMRDPTEMICLQHGMMTRRCVTREANHE